MAGSTTVAAYNISSTAVWDPSKSIGVQALLSTDSTGQTDVTFLIDTNNDGTVDITSAAIPLSLWGTASTASTIGSLSFGFQTSAPTSSSAGFWIDNVTATQNAVPEPASLSVLAIGAACLISRRR